MANTGRLSLTQLLPLLASLVVVVQAAAVSQAAAADEPIGRPQVRVGDAWTYRQTNFITQKNAVFAYRVTTLTDGRIKLATEGHSDWFTPDWNLVESSAGVKFAPHEGYFDFPLEPGKTYPFKAGRTVAKSHDHWQGMVRVQDWETIDVPAGSYRVLRVDINGTFGNGPVVRRAQLRQSYWWSAEVRRWVRHDLWLSRPAGTTADVHTRTELIRYAPAQ